jgi:putative hydrolase of the HAD superfamily
MIRAIIFDLDNTLVDFMSMKRLAVDAAIHAMIDAGLPFDVETAEKEILSVYEREGIEYQTVRRP